MTDYTLHCFLQSGNAYKAALMLQLAGADWKPQFVDFINGAHRSPEFRAINDMGEVPVLVDHTQGDLTLTQSGLILWHLADAFPQFAATNPVEHREVLRWILFDNHKMTGSLSIFRFLKVFMNKGDSPEAQFMKGRMVAALKTLNRRLDGRDWVAAPHCTIADISLAGYLYWPDQSEIDLADYQHIAKWLDRIAALPNYARPEDIMPASAEV
ncbi:glutathione S-transferase family protein [Ahrensia sp. R2A130]|uniref:glutathione S-transferase family protein n=1 Tax=Ahrensia sp. R2A130 TaxID=744979 RepID=UPI0001E0CA2A|nr:glutathione S-transferase [Ahrensia sp. R2A130]EFL87868.1 glutathione S-transferase domain-containing protein [Ahrensia sp. R2A130]